MYHWGFVFIKSPYLCIYMCSLKYPEMQCYVVWDLLSDTLQGHLDFNKTGLCVDNY